ncbi:MAG: hypothetical protein KIT84_38915 [Labilithrix sp.]|nr:hypothetical protein [Labilithrix sp.]MCW5817034.1 hypothetical protein [Labilithrix sp.]
MKRAAVIAGALMLALGVGCGAPKTSVTEVWQAPSPVTPRMKTLLVFGVRVDEPNRRAIEDTFVADLSRYGVKAAQSYVLFPGELPPIDRARAMVNEQHYEGILVLKMRGVHEESRYVPGSYGGFWHGYYGGWGYYGTPGYVVTDKTVIFEATLWDLRNDDKLVWTARTETLNPSSGSEFATSLTRGVNPALVRAGFLPPRPKD